MHTRALRARQEGEVNKREPLEGPGLPASEAESRRRTVLGWIAEFLFGAEDAGAGQSVLRLLAFVWGMVGIGLASLLFPAAAEAIEGNYSQALSIVGVGLFLAGAATAAGSMLGFLFGVPRASPGRDPDGIPNSGDEPAYIPNTNLETISDWLTKVIVGVGLVQVREVVAWIDQVGRVAGSAMGDTEFMRVIATALLVHNLLMGFFQGFLVAYIYLPKVFAAARQSAESSTPKTPLSSTVEEPGG
jgi:hypothetical protein